MSTSPYMPFYISDYLADAAHLTTLEHGAYLLLIMTYWQKGESFQAPDEQTLNKRLTLVARVSNEEWSLIKKTLSEFFETSPTEWRHDRIESELSLFRSKCEQKRQAGRASAQKRSKIKSTNVQQTLSKRSASVEQTLNDTDTDTDTDIKEDDDDRTRARKSVDNFLIDGYKKLLTDRGFYLHALINGKTLEMFQAWFSDGVTVDEAAQAMDRGDAQLGAKPKAPSYYRNIPTQIREEFKQAQTNNAEVTHAKKQPRQFNQRISATQRFYDKAFADLAESNAAIEELAEKRRRERGSD